MSINPTVVQIQNYQQAHPEVHTWNRSWSTLAYRPAVPVIRGISGMRASPVYRPNLNRNFERQFRGQPRPFQGQFRRGGGRPSYSFGHRRGHR